MTRAKSPPAEGHHSLSRHAGSAEIAAVVARMVARTASAVLDLLRDGVPRSKTG